MMLFAAKTNPFQAVSFLEDFCYPAWTLVAMKGERWVDTKTCKTKQEVVGFLHKHRGSTIGLLLGYSRKPINGMPQPQDLVMSSGVAVEIPMSKLGELLHPPAAWIEGPGYGIAVWRFLIHMPMGAARRIVTTFATRFRAQHGCRSNPLSFMIPLPGGCPDFELVFQRKGTYIDALSFEGGEPRRPPRPAKPEDEDEAFVRGDQVEVTRGLPVIKKGWVPGEAITILIGQPKAGKSLGVAKLASYVTSGGSIESGGWRAGWWDDEPVQATSRGSVIVCEEEDPRLETLARLQAAGCNMAKVHARMMVPDISVPAQLKKITGLAEELGDCRLISFSPFSSALRLRNYTEDAVREKIRPLLRWVRGKGIGVLAIVHLDDEGRTSGSKVIPRVCRSGIAFEPAPKTEDSMRMRVSHSNAGKMGVTLPYRIEGVTVTIDGTPIETARILFK
jgi:hypothetical protein